MVLSEFMLFKIKRKETKHLLLENQRDYRTWRLPSMRKHEYDFFPNRNF